MPDPATAVGDRPATGEAPALRHSALIETHRRLGAKLTPFGGWEMPLAYPSGTVAEHLACRREAVVFDVSHLGTVRVEGAEAFDRLQAALSNDLRKIEPGRAQYTHLLDEADGSVVDDIIVWWLGDEVFDVMPNASNTRRVLEAVGGVDTTSERCVLAVQGPAARSRLATVAADAAAVRRFGVARFEWHGATAVAAGTGYTGEDGVECALPAAVAPDFFDALVAAGVQPAGLGARDTLRLEAGLPLHGHELGPGISPLQAGLGWVVGWDKPAFRGREALVAERARGVSRRLVGIGTEGRQPPREGGAVLGQGQQVGTVTSGNFSPVLGHGIALALVAPTVSELGTDLEIEQRGRRLPGAVTALPFVRGGTTVGAATT
ncbi:MAG: glycine cleavage system aminomethyltransferase GcvT [Acidimicrobiales bacterium]|nr:glycine cleavage system aminomethyltransferase GcvT [Acidimicrobiales bacterium]